MFIKKPNSKPSLFAALFFLASISIIFSNKAYAAKVLQVKNGKALIDLESDSASANQEFFLVNGAGKKTAIIRILQVRPGKAVANVIKGTAVGGERLLAKSGGGSASSTANQGTTPVQHNEPVYDSSSRYGSQKKVSGKAKNSRTRASVLLNMMMNNMAAVESDLSGAQETVAMKGSSFGVTGAVDYPMWPNLTLRGTVGYEPFAAAGSAGLFSCNGQTSQECNAMITYIAFGGYLRYDILKDTNNLWIAGGGTMRMPMGKSSTALNEGDIAMTATYGVAVGYDIFMNNNKNFIPLSFEMQYFLPSETVKTDFMSIRGGYGFVF